MRKLIIILNDFNSINSELLFKCWKKISKKDKKRIFIITNYSILKNQFKKLNYKIKLQKFKTITNHSKSDNLLKIIDVKFNTKDLFKKDQKLASRFLHKTLNLGHKIALNKAIQGLITLPINKRLLKKNIGLTEFFASKSNIKNNSEVMLITNGKFSVCPITTHTDIKQISKKLNEKFIINKIYTINDWLKLRLKRNPKIGILGLNPHNAELKKNSEETKLIIPCIKKAQKSKININGPLVADTVFINDYKKYDVIIGMYHDQVLAPFKSIFKFNAINLTLGLKYLRVSPDHGVAEDLIGKNKANPESLIKCISFFNKE